MVVSQKVASGLWEIRRPLRLIGVEYGTRMTIVQLADGGLFLHSPVRLSSQTRETLDSLGQVKYIVAPNTMHHLFVPAYFEAFPNARVLAAPGLDKKRKDLKFHGWLGETPETGYSDALDQMLLQGTRDMFNEVVFFHKPTRTLIVTDLLFNFRESHSLWEKVFFKLNKLEYRPSVSRIFRSVISNKKAMRASVDRMLAWEPERLIMAHGEIVDSGAKAALESAFDWL